MGGSKGGTRMSVEERDELTGTARPGGRLRRVAGGRRRVVKVMLSPHEEEWLVPKAAAMGVSVQRLLVESAMSGGPPSVLVRRTLYQEFLAARRDVHGAANNLNQLARLGNEEGRLPRGIEPTLGRLMAAQGRLTDLAAQVTAHLSGHPRGIGE